MNISSRFCAVVKRWLAVAVLPFFSLSASSATFDFGVDPAHLGTGEWVYVISTCVKQLGGSAENVTNVPSMFEFFKKHGVDYIAVKAGTGGKDFPSEKPQFTPELVKQAHAAGLRIFGYTRSDGKDVPGEIALACKLNAMGTDGFIIDAEAEWESTKLGDKGPALAIELCKGIRKAYPTRFLGHAPMPIISKHSSFPYKEFGRYCDATMPQAYWKSIGVSPKRMVDWMENEWHEWNKSLSGDWTNAIKPLAPIAQAWSPTEDRILRGGEILQFANILKSVKNPASPTGYKGISYWRCDLHSKGMWKAIRRVNILSDGVVELEQDEKDDLTALEKINPAASQSSTDLILDNNADAVTFEGKWSPGKMKPNHFGSNYECIATVGGDPTAKAIYRPKITKAGHYDIYAWYPNELTRSGKVPYTIVHQGTTERVIVDQTTNGGQWVLVASEKFFEAGTAGYVSIANDLGNKQSIIVADAVRFRLSATIEAVKETADLTDVTSAPAPNEEKPAAVATPSAAPLSIVVASAELILGANSPGVTYSGNWHAGKMNANFYSDNYQWASTANGVATATATFQPDVKVAGPYDVYVWHSVSTNRSKNARWEIKCEDGSDTVRVNQRRTGGRWHLIAEGKHFAAGKSGYIKLSNDTGEHGNGENVIVADAVRLVLKTQSKAELTAPVAEKRVAKSSLNETAAKFEESERDILIDNLNPEVSLEGKWAAVNSSGCFGADCLSASTSAGTATATAVYRPTINVAGKYDVYVWYPQSPNNSTNAQWLVSWNGGN
ncbi:MAG: uncharacterized protein JWM68_1268, partial [Verrucomicrobiales bacterium]|nr:uncharacterized protein [Verrucomicrobiales bacterium]